MSFLFKYSAVLRIIKTRERCHRLKREEKKQKLAEKKRIEALFRSQMHFIIQNIEKTALLSEYANLLAAEVEPETVDQEMRDFRVQVDLTEKEQ
ncbi:uncharacterized protein BDCG_00537 [Blastomyces dermatitidis ER-3]|uniref:Uncharacterized protein n=1 Tax=Ajellomyces dermatitidis (strain ER-3 / ATCC MYA-2586) TaxID=559297 RepID=A0ABP2EKN8_AJEDR|nr:uncharacterized protein BDCG_00537 [Blastomyces dermatitidis ER-3]EEQ83732.2 hypothetical protein BDCG_00537 [Blastomyces dermatitidis ER-3]